MEEAIATIRIIEQPKSIFYKDEGGKNNYLTTIVKLDSPSKIEKSLALKFTLYYESFEPVEIQDQRILHILPIESRLPTIDKSTLNSIIHFRIEKVSRRKDGRKFRLHIQVEGSNDKCSVFSDPILVLSKHRTEPNLINNSPAVPPPIITNLTQTQPIVDHPDITKIMDMCTEMLTRQNKTEQSLLVLIKRVENMERNLFQMRIPQFDLTQPAQKFDYLLSAQQQPPPQQTNNNALQVPLSPQNNNQQQQQQPDFSSLTTIDSSRSIQQLSMSSNNNNINGGMEGIKRSISSQMFIPRLMSYGYGGMDVPTTFLPDIPDNPNKIRRLLSSDIEFTLECKSNEKNNETNEKNNHKS